MTKQYYSDKGADPYREALVMYFYSMPYMYDDMSLKKDESETIWMVKKQIQQCDNGGYDKYLNGMVEDLDLDDLFDHRYTQYTYYENRQKEYKWEFMGYKEDGTTTHWYESGQLERERNYKDGELNGLYSSWYENGQKKSEENYKDGNLDGEFTKWHENGKKRIEGNYKDGNLDGEWNLWHENGKKRIEGNYKDGKGDGEWNSWHEDGQKNSEVNYKDGKVYGEWNTWYENGQKKSERNYKDGKWTKWYENGQKKFEYYYKAGETMKMGEAGQSYAETYGDDIESYVVYKNKILTLGDTIIWGSEQSWESLLLNMKQPAPGAPADVLKGKLSILDGEFTVWHENGKKSIEGNYKDGKVYGEWNTWYENGKKKFEINYKDGNLDGEWNVWHENGKKKSERNYKDGNLYFKTTWDENGTKTEENSSRVDSSVELNSIESCIQTDPWSGECIKKAVIQIYGSDYDLETKYNKDGGVIHEIYYQDGTKVDISNSIDNEINKTFHQSKISDRTSSKINCELTQKIRFISGGERFTVRNTCSPYKSKLESLEFEVNRVKYRKDSSWSWPDTPDFEINWKNGMKDGFEIYWGLGLDKKTTAINYYKNGEKIEEKSGPYIEVPDIN
jgi:antitoxin component YwqK of YwqJK toxin-antitoxin module